MPAPRDSPTPDRPLNFAPGSIIVSVGGRIGAAKAATSTIPIVFATGLDPVEAGPLESISRPGGNATGYTIWTNEVEPKRLDLLHELVPNVGVYGALINPNSPIAARYVQELEEAARRIGKRIFAAYAGNDTDLDIALGAHYGEQVGALLVTADSYFDTRRREGVPPKRRRKARLK